MVGNGNDWELEPKLWKKGVTIPNYSMQNMQI